MRRWARVKRDLAGAGETGFGGRGDGLIGAGLGFSGGGDDEIQLFSELGIPLVRGEEARQQVIVGFPQAEGEAKFLEEDPENRVKELVRRLDVG